MAVIGKTFRVNYSAKNFTPELTDVEAIVLKPDGTKLPEVGTYSLIEYEDDDAQGVYYFDFTGADIEGAYLFIMDSETKPLKSARQEYFYPDDEGFTAIEKAQLLVNIAFIADVEGGNYKLEPPNDLTFYKSDGETVVARFKTFNDIGVPAIENITKVERIG